MSILLTDPNVKRLVTLLALAETATSTEEYLRYATRATALKREHPELAAIHEDDPRVQARAAQYPQERQDLAERYGPAHPEEL